MAFRLAVIPAGSAGSAEQAQRLVAAMRARPGGFPPVAVVEVLGALESSGLGDFTVWRRTDSRGALLSVRYPELGVLEGLLLLAKDRGLAVYDIELNRLYDPTGAIDVQVTQPGVQCPFVTRQLLVDVVLSPAWPDPEAPFVILDRAEQDFIQVWCSPHSYQLEYRECGPDFHFIHITDDPHLVIDVMWAWGIGNPYWRGAVPWEFFDLAAEDLGESRSPCCVDPCP